MKEVNISAVVLPGGKLSANVTEEYTAFMLENVGETLQINISLSSSKGTILQDVYFRKVVMPCLQRGFKETGNDMRMQEVFETIRHMCPATENVPDEECLSKEELSELIEFSIRVCAVEFKISVPEPTGR